MFGQGLTVALSVLHKLRRANRPIVGMDTRSAVRYLTPESAEFIVIRANAAAAPRWFHHILPYEVG